MAFSISMIALALAGSAFISGAEAALLSARMSRIEDMAGRGDRRAHMVVSVLERYENFFATILLFGNLFNIIVAVAASNLLVATIAGGETTIITNILATALATILVYIVGELTPKTIGAAYPEGWSLAVAHIISALIWIARPVVFIFTSVPVFLMRRFRISDTQTPIYTSGELSLSGADRPNVAGTNAGLLPNGRTLALRPPPPRESERSCRTRLRSKTGVDARSSPPRIRREWLA